MTARAIGETTAADLPRRPGRPARPVTREQLLKVAREAFAELGYAGASMGDIAARAGIRKSSLFHHFATKDVLYRDAVATVVDDVSRRMTDAQQSDGDVLARLDRATVDVQRYFGEHAVAARLLLRELVDTSATATHNTSLPAERLLRDTRAFLEEGMESGAIPRQDSAQLTLSVLGLYFLFFSVPAVSSRTVGADVFSPAVYEERSRVVCLHLRRLLGAPAA